MMEHPRHTGGNIGSKDCLTHIFRFEKVTLFYKWKFQYWKKRQVPFLTPKIPFGNIPNPFNLKEKPGIFIKQFYQEMKRNGWKHGGFYFFACPVYMVVDPDYIKQVLIKDFQYFVDRGIYSNEKDDPISHNLFSANGTKWKYLRTLLNPSFTSKKVKEMFTILLACEKFLKHNVENHQVIDVNRISANFTIDVITTCAFGLDCNGNQNLALKHFGEKTINYSKFKLFVLMLASIFPKLAKKFGCVVMHKNSQEFFVQFVAEIIKFREENNYTRDDFMQFLIKLKNNKTEVFTLEEVASQCVLFFIAGFETSHATMSFALYELAKHQEIQQKVREEFWAILDSQGGEITYGVVQKLKYLDQVLNETLRKYPVVMYLTRRCIKDYEVPQDGALIEKGTTVIVPTVALNYDEEYYPNPEKFDPQRFSEENKKLRHPCIHLPFGLGPRLCIGKRFALIQVKVGLVLLLKNYSFTVNPNTREPIKLKINSFISAPEDKILLDVHKL